MTNTRRSRCVIFRPGDCGIFEEDINCDLAMDSEIPEFNGLPEGEYYCDFDGWDREDLEDGDIIFTARWNRRGRVNDPVRVPDTLANIPHFIYIIGGIFLITGIILLISIKKKR